jgi:large subunit ribosomal protein L3
MARHHKPVAGSRGYWPRKRAIKIYSTPRTAPETDVVVPLWFAAYKAGMTQVSHVDNRKESPTAGQVVVDPVTVLESPALMVCGIKVYVRSHDGLKGLDVVWSEKLPKELAKKTSVPKKTDRSKLNEIEAQAEKFSEIRLVVMTQPGKAGFGKKKPDLFEVSLGGSDSKAKWEYAKQRLGQELKIDEIFKEGEEVDVKSVTKGKGFTGPVKRFGITIRPRKHEKKRRHVGNLGSVGVGRVLPGKIAMAGQHGFQTRTEYNKKILKIGNDGLNPKGGWVKYGFVSGSYVIVGGSVPGPRKRLVFLRKGIRLPEKDIPVEVKEVFLDSQQGT